MSSRSSNFFSSLSRHKALRHNILTRLDTFDCATNRNTITGSLLAISIRPAAGRGTGDTTWINFQYRRDPKRWRMQIKRIRIGIQKQTQQIGENELLPYHCKFTRYINPSCGGPGHRRCHVVNLQYRRDPRGLRSYRNIETISWKVQVDWMDTIHSLPICMQAIATGKPFSIRSLLIRNAMCAEI